MQLNATSIGTIGGILIVLVVLVGSRLNFKLVQAIDKASGTAPCNEAISNTGVGSATSGRLFKGEKTRTFDAGKLQFATLHPSEYPADSESFKHDELKCQRWSVVTTIFEPSDAVKKQAHVPGWCLVVVGDRKGPLQYEIENTNKNFVFLTAAMQESMAKHFPLVNALPWNHFGRKNVGYLYAILHGASTIWDFDDDNMLLSKHHMFELVPGASKAPAASSSAPSSSSASANSTEDMYSSVASQFTVLEAVQYPPNSNSNSNSSESKLMSFNPYPLMGAEHLPCWPRGLPLQDIKFNASQVALKPRKIPSASVGIVQSLANHDPDVDAIYRLTQPLPFDFPSKGLNVAVPKGSFAPYNAQATLHLYSALWSLLLPVTVHGRVSDIWRGYATKRLLDLLDLRLVFSPALVRQDRNVHNYLADFDSESDLYLRAQRLLEHLADWQPSAVALKSEHPLAACMEEIYVMMYEHGYLQLRDVELVQAWLHSLVAAGYKFPHVGGSSGSSGSSGAETEGGPKSKGNATSSSSSASTATAKNGTASSS